MAATTSISYKFQDTAGETFSQTFGNIMTEVTIAQATALGKAMMTMNHAPVATYQIINRSDSITIESD